ncbi:MAG: reprolysin-like metallopeptidase, partial [Saprospiraceae bacterium]
MSKILSFLLVSVCLAVTSLAAQGSDFFRSAPAPALSAITDLRPILPSQAGYTTAAPDALAAYLQTLPAEETVDLAASPALLRLPTPAGESISFRIVRYQMISASMAAAFPELVTAYGIGTKDPRLVVYLDWGYQGFHATVTGDPAGKWSIDPVWRNDQTAYQSYYHKNHTPTATADMSCGTDADYLAPTTPPLKSVGDCQLRQYDLALACTGEYYNYFTTGVNDAVVFSAMMTAVNRVNQVFRQDLAITLTLINDNNGGDIELLYDNPNTDPYTNSDQGLMINENQVNIDNVIGSSGYDIGHVFSTNGGGIASLASVCRSGQKARAVTGSPVPVGDNFLIDLVAHEMGHQFGATHSFNSTVSNCNQRQASTAYEPGSGTTIMAYAGICASANVQFASDPYYHAISIQQISDYMESGFGDNCASTASTANSAPSVNAGANFTIPRNTPFTLTATGSDPNGNPLTYCWEQFDLGPAVANMPTGNETTAPLFRSFPPTNDPSRTFPQLSNLLAGTSPWEALPLVSRNMTFIVTARDVNGNYGCTVQDQTEITVAGAGPFRVTAPNGGETWVANSTRTVTWNVAGTTGNGINTNTVRIELSYDGGFTYPVTLLANTPNDGSQQITVPDVTENQARVRISAVGNIYFDISDDNFSIERTDFTLEPNEATVTQCVGSATAQFGFSVNSVMGFNGAVTLSTSGLPGGVSRSFSPGSTVTPPVNGSTNVLLNLSGTGGLAVGSYSFTLTGVSGSRTRSETLTLVVEAKPTTAPTNLIPAPGGSVPVNMQSFSWNAVAGADVYEFRICPNPGGAGGGCATATVSGTTANFGSSLPYNNGETAYWRVTALNENCPNEGVSSPFQAVNFGTVPTGASLSSSNSPRTICQGTNTTTFQVGFMNGALTGPASLTVLSTTLPGSVT